MEPEYRPEQSDRDDRYSCYYGTGAPPRRHHHGLLVLLSVIALLLIAAALISQRYRMVISSRGPFSITFEDKTADSSAAHGVWEPGSTEPEEFTKTASPPAAVLGSGETLEITDAGEDTEPLTLQEIYRQAIPSVASILATTQSGPVSGTGIIMTEDGYLITNNHVIESAVSIDVILQDESEFAAALVGADSVSDLAVLKIDADNLTPAEFGDSAAVEVGDSVVAIGDPLGIELRGTMTDGIISAINRDITTNGRTMTLLQTNAQLNSGNSGGPLLNRFGQVIGINTMKLGSYSSSVEGIGFAIPISSAKPIIDELISQGYVSGRPAIGIQGDAVPPYAQAYYRMPSGIYVNDVYQNSDAAAQGLVKGDIITAVDGAEVASLDDLNVIKNRHTSGDTITLTVYRSGSTFELDIVLMDQNDAD